MMEKETFIKYVEMLHRFEQLSKEELSIYSNTVETKTIVEVRKLVEKKPELMSLLKKIHSLPEDQRLKAVLDYFSKEDKKEEETTKTSENKIEDNITKDNNEVVKKQNEVSEMIEDTKTEEVKVEKSNEKPKKLIKETKYGFISNVLLVSIITAVILVGVLIYYVVRYYS